MIILFYFPLASLIQPYTGGIKMLLCTFLTDTWNNNLGTTYFSVLTSIGTFRCSFDIVDCKTYGWCITQYYTFLLNSSLILVCPLQFGILDYSIFTIMIDLIFVLEAPNIQTAVFVSH